MANREINQEANSSNVFGEDEKFWYRCGAGDHVVGLLNKENISKDATIRISTREFREDKWGFGTSWHKFAEKKLSEKVKIKAYGGPGVEVSDALIHLQTLGLEIFEISNTKEKLKEHYLTVDNPKIVWAESLHEDFYAYGCIYADRPFSSAWLSVNKYFEDIERDGKWLTQDDIKNKMAS